MIKMIKINRRTIGSDNCSTDLVFVDSIIMIKKVFTQLNKSHIYLILDNNTELDITIGSDKLEDLYNEIEKFILYSKEQLLEFTINNK